MALPIFIFTEYSPQRRSRKANQLLVQMRARNRAVCSIFRKLKTLSTPLHQCSSSLLQCSDGGRYAPPQRGYEFKTILPVFLKVGPCGLNVLPHHLGGQRKQTSALWLVYRDSKPSSCRRAIIMLKEWRRCRLLDFGCGCERLTLWGPRRAPLTSCRQCWTGSAGWQSPTPLAAAGAGSPDRWCR